MRVISGSAGGITLKLPKTDLRPTMDLVRGAIFSSLGVGIEHASVLDLFAGTGSIAIEALSRGAASATLVEADRKACAIITENLARTRLKARIVCNDVFRFLESKLVQVPVDFVFADPPYSKKNGDRDFAGELLRRLAQEREAGHEVERGDRPLVGGAVREELAQDAERHRRLPAAARHLEDRPPLAAQLRDA